MKTERIFRKLELETQEEHKGFIYEEPIMMMKSTLTD